MDYKNAVLNLVDCSWARNKYDELTLSGMVVEDGMHCYPLNVMMPDDEQKRVPMLHEDQVYKVYIEIKEFECDAYDNEEAYKSAKEINAQCSPIMVIPVGTMEGDGKGAFIIMHGIVKAIDNLNEESCVVSISSYGGIYHILTGKDNVDSIKIGKVITGKFYVEGRLVV